MSVQSNTGTVNPTANAQQIVAMLGSGPFDNLSAYVQGGSTGSYLFRLFAIVDGVQVLVARANILASQAASLIAWQQDGGDSTIISAAGEAYILTVQSNSAGASDPVTVTLAGVDEFDTAPGEQAAESFTLAAGATGTIGPFQGFSQAIDVGVDQTLITSPITVSVLADCGPGSVQAVVKSVTLRAGMSRRDISTPQPGQTPDEGKAEPS